VNLKTLPESVRIAIEATQDKKAADIVVIDLREVGGFTSYFVICTGFSSPQLQAICEAVEEQLYKQLNRSPEHREGRGAAEWALLDFGSFVVHVFSEQARRFYDLERLWRSAPKLEIPNEAETPATRGSVRNAAIRGGTHPPGEAVSK
jgi:ribosome-associated protein